MHNVTGTIWRKVRLRISQGIGAPFLLQRAPSTLPQKVSSPAAIKRVHALFSPLSPLPALYPLTLLCPVLLTQGKFLHFPSRRFGQSLDKFNDLRGLE